jgi:hypothetical protein
MSWRAKCPPTLLANGGRGGKIACGCRADFLLTAGHCGGINTPWKTTDFYGSGGNVIGTEINRDSGGDTAVISVTGNEPFFYDKGFNSTVGEVVDGARSATKGQGICTEGATSGVP